MTYFMLTQIIMEEKNLEHCPEKNFFSIIDLLNTK